MTPATAAAAKARILVADQLTDESLRILESNGEFEVVNEPEITQERLAAIAGEFDALVIRSRARAPIEVLQNSGRLRVIGRAGVGLDNVDVPAATERGIIVMNTPEGNTLSTAEHTISMILSLVRNIPRADATMKAGKWEKKVLTGHELYGKTLGIVGLGKIGREVAARMRSFGMRILGHDPYITEAVAEKLGIEVAEVDRICREADIITVHVPFTPETKGIINAERIALMKPDVYLVNCARGGIIDEAALLEALEKKRISGAALDVFLEEPLPADHPFRKLTNVVLTPHLAASTTEAQEKVTRDVANQIVEVLRGGMIRNAINAPSIDPREMDRMRPVLNLCERLGKFASQFFHAPVEKLEILYAGVAADFPQQPLTISVVKGFLEPQLGRSVNYVNAMVLAKSRGIEVAETRSSETFDFTGLVTVRGRGEGGRKDSISGTLFHGREPRLVIINGMQCNVKPETAMLVVQNRDVPGMIGKVGTLMGDYGINIADMSLGRDHSRGDAITVLNVDDPIPAELLEKLRADPAILSVHLIQL